MSIVKAKSVQIGIDATAANNFALYVPTVADGTVRLGNGNSGSVTDLITVTAAGNVGIGTGTPSTKLQVSGTITATSFAGPISGLTSGRVTYAGTAGLLQDDADFTFNGTTVTMANDASISGLTVGKGGGAVVGNSAIGFGALANNTGSQNTAVGYNAMTTNTSGIQNTASGQGSLNNNTTGGQNSAFGYLSLYSNTSAAQNSAFGTQALTTNTTGTANTAVGYQSLISNTTASNTTAVGYQAAYYNTTGAGNTAIGNRTLFFNATGNYNSAFGSNALYNSTGSSNSAFGSGAMTNNTSGIENTAMGTNALSLNTTGSFNCAFGEGANYANTTSSAITAVGYRALLLNTSPYNTAVGYQAGYSNTTGKNNTFLGYQSGYYVTTGSKNSVLGAYNGNQGGLDIRTASNYIVLSDGDGNPLAFTANSKTFALQGGTISSGTGIAFPAIQSASSDANTLDDYEEGTWTPTGIGQTFARATGKYTKIGRVVYLSWDLTWSVTGAGNQAGFIGFPFASDGSTFAYTRGVSSYSGSMVISSPGYAGTASGVLLFSFGNPPISDSEMSGLTLSCSGFYFTS